MDPLEIAILNAGGPNRPAIVYARCGSDVALATLPAGAELKALVDFQKRVHSALLQTQPRPGKQELVDFGRRLFAYVVRDDVARLYSRIPLGTFVRIHILTNRPDLQSLPWEYLQDPNQVPGPGSERSVIRIVPTIGRAVPAPLPKVPAGQKIKILFVYADPSSEGPVSWPNVRASIDQVFASKIPPDRYEITPIPGTPQALFKAFENAADRYEIFQFSGHGDLDPNSNEGRLLLLNEADSSKSIPLPASLLAGLLNNRGIRLAVLSACMTGAGNSADPFSVMAEALIRSGIPAVVANQLPVPDASVATFVGPLYTNLLTTGDIDVAVSQGRIKLALDLGTSPLASLEWGIPTLFRHIAASQVFLPQV